MNILYLCHPDNYHIRKWVSGLTRKGVTIHLAGMQQAQIDYAPYTRISSVFETIRYWDFPLLAAGIHQLTEKLKPDLIFASFAPTFGLTAKRSGFRPYVVQTWSRDIGQDPNMSLREQLMISYISTMVMQSASGITTDGMAYKDALLERWPQFQHKTLGTPWGIDLNVFQPSVSAGNAFRERYKIPDGAQTITSIRGVGSYYQPVEILRGIARSARHHPEAHYIVPTLNHERTKAVNQLLVELKKCANIHIIDRLLTQNEMIGLWSATDFFISCPHFDGVSESLSEGRAMGAVPILNPLPSNLERAQPGDHAFYTPNVEVTALHLSDTISKALNASEEFITHIKHENLKWVQQHADVNKTLDNLIHFFDDIIRSHRA